MARNAVRAAVLVAPVPAHPAVASLAAIARRHQLDALRIVGGGSLPLRAEYLFHELDDAAAAAYADRCGGESPLVQYQLLLHRPARPPLGSSPVLVLATPDDRLVPINGVRRTAARYGADLVEFPGMGHDLMLDARWARAAGRDARVAAEGDRDTLTLPFLGFFARSRVGGPDLSYPVGRFAHVSDDIGGDPGPQR